MALDASKYKATEDTEFTFEFWNRFVVDFALAMTEVQAKAESFDAATDQLIQAALFQISSALAPANASRDMARDWAEKADNTDVDGVGTRSAKHHANAAIAQVALAVAARVLAETARDAAEGFKDDAEAAAAAAELFDPETYAPKASPTFTGTPSAPTAAPGTNTTQLATAAFVSAAVAAVLGSPPGNLNTLQEIAAAIGNDASFAATVATALAARVTLTGAQTLADKTLTNPVINGFTGNPAVVNIGAGQIYKAAGGAIGFGTTTPSEELVLFKDQNAATVISVQNPNAGSAAQSILMLAAGPDGEYYNIVLDPTNNYAHEVAVGAVVTKYSDFNDHIFRKQDGTEKFRATQVTNIANVRASAAGTVITADVVETSAAIVGLTDAATIAVDWDGFFGADVVLSANRALGNPTNVQVGTSRQIMVKGNSGTLRTLTFGANYKSPPALADISNAKYYLLTLWAYSATHIAVGAIEQVP